MKRYDERMLEMLLDIYERSLLYAGKNKKSQSISAPVSKKTFPEYFDMSALQFDVIHQQLEQLESKGIVRLVWKNKKRGHILEKCELVTERAEDAYRLLHRKPKHEKEQKILEICDAYQGKAKETDHFLEWIRKRIKEGESVQRYADLDQPQELSRLCELTLRILKNPSECFLRQFSVRHFHDSKTAESTVKKAVHVISEFSGDGKYEEMTEEEILAEYNIYQNPSWLMMKGSVKFQKQHGDVLTEVALNVFDGGIGISNQDIETIFWNPDTPIGTVLTVENLTSFHQWSEGKEAPALCIYLGGYHNHVKRVFLQKIYKAYPHAEYYHFGDIDCGGFRIWKDLCLKTGIPFQTLHMDMAAYDQYRAWGRQLTEQDRRTLNAMVKDPFFYKQTELFKKMLEQGIKVEQECIEG